MAELSVVLVSAHPPSRASLTEYGFYLAKALGADPRVETLSVFSNRVADETYAPGTLPVWDLDRMTTPVAIVRAVAAHRPDVVIFSLQNATFGSRVPAAVLGLLTPWLCRVLGFPTIVVLHNLADQIDPAQVGFGGGPIWRTLYRFGSRLMTWMLLRANRVTVTVPRYVEHLGRRYRARNVRHVPHGGFPDDSAPSPPPEEIRLLAFGKFGTYKRVEVLLDAARLLIERGIPAEVVVAGTDNPNSPGYLASVAQRYRDLEGLTFTGYVEEEHLPDVFGSAWAVVMPYTSTTGASGVLHQAAGFGRPVLMPAIGDFLDLMHEQGFDAEQFEADDPESLAEAVTRLLKDPQRRDEIVAANRAAAGEVPMSEVARRLIDLAEEIVR